MSAASAGTRTAQSWHRLTDTCRVCGEAIYSSTIRDEPTPDTDGVRILFRHGDGARAPIIEWVFSESRREFVSGNPTVEGGAGDGSWQHDWERAIHGQAVTDGR